MSKVNFLWLLLFFLCTENGFSQYDVCFVIEQNEVSESNDVVKCVYGDSSLMVLSVNGKTYQFIDGLSDGIYVAFTSDLYVDSVLSVAIQNGELNGIVTRWMEGQIVFVAQYKGGSMNGWRKDFLYSSKNEKVYIDLFYCVEHICDIVQVYEEEK